MPNTIVNVFGEKIFIAPNHLLFMAANTCDNSLAPECPNQVRGVTSDMGRQGQAGDYNYIHQPLPLLSSSILWLARVKTVLHDN